jgi:hypothetical protein
MNEARFQDTRRQILLVSSLIQQLDAQDLIDVLEYIQRAEEIGIGDRAAWEKIHGDTELLKWVVQHLLDIKSVLPERR